MSLLESGVRDFESGIDRLIKGIESATHLNDLSRSYEYIKDFLSKYYGYDTKKSFRIFMFNQTDSLLVSQSSLISALQNVKMQSRNIVLQTLAHSKGQPAGHGITLNQIQNNNNQVSVEVNVEQSEIHAFQQTINEASQFVNSPEKSQADKALNVIKKILDAASPVIKALAKGAAEGMKND